MLVSAWEQEQLAQYMNKKLYGTCVEENSESIDTLKRQLQMPCISTVFGSVLSKSTMPEVSTCGSKSPNESSLDMGEIPQENLRSLLDSNVETEFSVSVQKKRRRLVEVLQSKRTFEIVIKPHKKVFKGNDVQNFRGSKFRGISKNGNSWQILVMVNRKKKYLGTLPTEE